MQPGAGKGVMKFYEGSKLHIEWTNQHGCGDAQKVGPSSDLLDSGALVESPARVRP